MFTHAFQLINSPGTATALERTARPWFDVLPAGRSESRASDSSQRRRSFAESIGSPSAGENSPARSIERRGVQHGMLSASQVASRWRIAGRHIIVKLLSKLPGARFKTWLVRKLLGVKCGKDVGFAYGSLLDPYDPSMISFGDNVIVGFEAKIFVHMFTLTRQRIKPVKVGNNVIIGACSIIAPGVTIGDGASIAPGTIVTRNVPAGALAMGNPMQVKKRCEATH